jgi:hypothetical protein
LDVEQYRWDFKPPGEIKGIILAESHVAWPKGNNGPLSFDDRYSLEPTSAEADGIHDNAKTVGLIYCPAYGDKTYPLEHSIIENNRPVSKGTDYWSNVFFPAAYDTSGNTRVPTRRTAPWPEKKPILDKLMERGIWLLDASPIAIYIGDGVRLTNNDEDLKEIFKISWKNYLYPLCKKYCSSVIKDCTKRLLFLYDTPQQALTELYEDLRECKNAHLNYKFKKGHKLVKNVKIIREWASEI